MKYFDKKVAIFFLFLINVVGTNLHSDPTEGIILYSSREGAIPVTNLIDSLGTIWHNWEHSFGSVSGPQIVDDSTLLYQYRVQNPTMIAGGEGGGMQLISWNGDILKEVILSNDSLQHHHDALWLTDNTFLVLAWERKTSEEAFAAGRKAIENPLNQMWSEAILEIAPIYPDSFEVVWAWYLWDHLIQDADSSLPNYGQISLHPERMDINYGTVGAVNAPGGSNADWLHFNSLDYDSTRDLILISSRNSNEIFIIDHSTTTEQAADSVGGFYGKGGDFLYRWGNPQAYKAGDSLDQKLFWNHEANWIPNNYPDSGKVIIFNNGYQRIGPDFTSIEILEIPENFIITETGTFGPEEFFTTVNLDDSLFTTRLGGAFQLPNGHILASISMLNKIIQFSLDGEIVWQHEVNGNLTIARKYFHFEYPTLSTQNQYNNEYPTLESSGNYPNPFNYQTEIRFNTSEQRAAFITIYDPAGRIIKKIEQKIGVGKRFFQWNGENELGNPVSSGLYIYRIQVGKSVRIGKMIFLK